MLLSFFLSVFLIPFFFPFYIYIYFLGFPSFFLSFVLLFNFCAYFRPNYACAFGQFDIAGSPKPHAYWYVVNWLQLQPAGAHDRPPVPTRHLARMLDLAANLDCTSEKCTITAISTGGANELFVNGSSAGVQHPNTLGDQTQWTVALNAAGTIPAVSASTAAAVDKAASADSANSAERAGSAGRATQSSQIGGGGSYGAAALESGDATSSSSACNFSIPLTGNIQCKRLVHQEGVGSAGACESACCATIPSCNVWQYDDAAGCWAGAGVDIGSQCNPNPDRNDTWSGSGR
jgi:hypothetical protein